MAGFSSYDVPAYLRGDGNAFLEGAVQYANMGQLPEKKNVAVDVNEFIRTRDAVSFTDDTTQARKTAIAVTATMTRTLLTGIRIVELSIHEPLVEHRQSG